MPSVTGNVSVTEWVAEAKEKIQEAIEAITQIISIIDDVKGDIGEAPIFSRKISGYQRKRMLDSLEEEFDDLDDGQMAVEAIIAHLKAVPWKSLELCRIREWREWGNSAIEAKDRADGEIR